MAAPTRFLEEDSVDVVFHGTAYNLCLSTFTDGSAAEPTLALDLEELATGAAWHGEFPAAYIESITSKTGSFKRFDVLVMMLQGALWRQADTVYLDLLTYADLVRLSSTLDPARSAQPGG
jgi:coiled-coil domain-containing protein 61